MEKKFSVKNGLLTDYTREEMLDLIDIAMAAPGTVAVIQFADGSFFKITEAGK